MSLEEGPAHLFIFWSASPEIFFDLIPKENDIFGVRVENIVSWRAQRPATHKSRPFQAFFTGFSSTGPTCPAPQTGAITEALPRARFSGLPTGVLQQRPLFRVSARVWKVDGRLVWLEWPEKYIFGI